MIYKAAIFDVDGVLNRQPELFAQKYARENNLESNKLETFFDKEFEACSLGKADLKELIVKRNDLWQWSGDPQGLIDQWFEFENHPDQELLAYISEKQQAGLKVYVATIQEKYRAEYLKTTLFKDRFDGLFITCEIGFHKRDPELYEHALEHIREDNPGITAQEVIYFDDKQEGLDTAQQLGFQTCLYQDMPDATAVLQ